MLPRQVLPRQFYMITRRCSQRQFLLRPDRETNNAFTYCLLEAALRCKVEVLLTCAMSNHHHTVIYDRWGRYPEFVEHFHKMFARSQNALRGRWENLWSSDQVCVVKLVDRDAVMDKLVYTATNPVADHLVDRVHHWPGINGLTALLAGRCLRATRPQHFFRPDGPMPEAVEMRLAIPPELGSEAELLAELRDPSVLSSSISISRPSAAAPAVGCWDGAACSRSRGAINRRVASPGGAYVRRWRPGASGRGSRRCCATVHSSRTTPAPGSNGGTVRRSHFRPAPTGSDDSRTCRWQRRKCG
jgi:REP element-mobilizing transposase RayT